MLLFYATIVGDYERVIQHWILEEDWLKAIDTLNRQVRLFIYPGVMIDKLMKLVGSRAILSFWPSSYQTCVQSNG
jgi:hypothetical protein